MAKPKNLIPTATITVSTTEQVEKYLEVLVHTGEFGKNTAEAAERVLVLGLQNLMGAGRLERVKDREK
jgi:Arc/MetJ-type ribon-helix-helix transcriptional regulator